MTLPPQILTHLQEAAEPALMLFGPTASGKSALSLELAAEIQAETGRTAVIVNADSRQVYTGMDILTAMPSAADFAAAPHALFKILDPAERFSAAAYSAAVQALVPVWKKNGQIPIFTGGTGFYLQALEQGMSPIPEVPEEVLNALIQAEKKSGLAPLRQELEQVDPTLAAKLKPADTQRTLRALAVWRATGQPLSHWQTLPSLPPTPYDFLKIALSPPPETVRARIEKRFDTMWEQGVRKEVQALREAGCSAEQAGLKTVGIEPFFDYLEGKLTKEALKEQVVADTWQYARRQYTWLRGRYGADFVIS